MSTTTPVSTERIRQLLSDRDVSFGEYGEAELAIPTRNAVFFWNMSNPQVLQLRAQWRGIATDDAQFTALVNEVSACNSSRILPKAYLAPLEEAGKFGLIAECNVVASQGFTKAQLDAFWESSMSMILTFITDLEAALPEFVTWSDELDIQEDN